MEFRILGPLEVIEQGHPVPLGGMRQRALLAALLLRANTVVPADRLLEEVWGDDQPASGLRSVQVYVSQLRKLLGDGAIETRSPGYMLVAGDGALDLHCFEELLAQARGRDPTDAAAKLREALSLWRGPPLAEFAYASFAQAEIGRLEELRLTALEARLDADLALGRHAEIVAELESLVAEHPLRERLRAQRMLALYRSERQSEALAVYQEGTRLLRDELGLEPGRLLRDLQQSILRQDPSLDLVREVPAAAEARGAFVGRQAELAQLLEGLEAAIAGRGGLFLLAGEPGIGKSRLADELIAQARTRGARVLIGRCWEAGGAPPYWPWVQALRSYVREADPGSLVQDAGTGAADLAELLPELRELLPDLPEPRPVEPDAARFRLFDAVTQLLRDAGARRPIVLFLDDLHAADAPSLLLLQFLVRELGTARVLVVGAYRDIDPLPDEALTEMLAAVAREPMTRRLLLGGLAAADVSDYVEQTAAEIASPELIAAVTDQTEGNPLFLTEMVRLLALEGGDAPAIPETIRDVITRRLVFLSADCNRVLALASVLGREFAHDALARLAELSVDALLDTLDEATTARTVTDVPGVPGRMRFAHVLVRDTLYDRLSAARRVRLHRRALEELEALYADNAGPHLGELAYHAVAGSDFERGVDYARRAGDRAFGLLAYEEAARLYATALTSLELGGASDDRERYVLLVALGEAEGAAGNATKAKETFLAAAAIARSRGMPRELARAAVGYGGRLVFDRAAADRRLVPLLEEALAGLTDEDQDLRIRLLARLSGALRDEHSRTRRDRASREAVELARASSDLTALGYALDGRAGAIWGPDNLDECLALADELYDVAGRAGDLDRLGTSHILRVHVHVHRGELRRAEDELASASRIADELKQPAKLWEVSGIHAMLALGAGRFAEAEELVPKAFAYGERAQPGMAVPVYRLHSYALCDYRGGHAEFEPALADLAAARPERPMFRCALAHLHARIDRQAEAGEALGELVRDDVTALPFDAEWVYAMSLLAETAAILDDEGAAAVLYPLLAPSATLNAADVGEGIRGSVRRYLGLLAATLGRTDEARRHFEGAIEANERWGLLPWLAFTQRDYARLLRGSKHAGELLDRADALCAELGMAPP